MLFASRRTVLLMSVVFLLHNLPISGWTHLTAVFLCIQHIVQPAVFNHCLTFLQNKLPHIRVGYSKKKVNGVEINQVVHKTVTG